MTEDPEFPQIKKELVESVQRLEAYMEDGVKQREELTSWMKKVHIKVYGDADANPPIAGMGDRIRKLEAAEDSRRLNRENIVKLCIGSATMAVGAAVLWGAKAIIAAFKAH